MRPILFQLGPFPIGSYAFFVGLGFLVAALVRRAEVRRLGYGRNPAHRWVGLGALLGAMVGSKLGMVLFAPPEEVWTLLQVLKDFNFTGKTVVGGLIGGYLGVELTKKLVGIHHSTGDGWAVAVPLGQAIGRVGCFFNGCCYGRETDSPLGVSLLGVMRHPTQLYEAALDLLLAGALWLTRKDPRPEGHLFRRYLVGYALIRFGMEFLRGDNSQTLGPLTLVQWVCLSAALGFSFLIVRREWKPAP